MADETQAAVEETTDEATQDSTTEAAPETAGDAAPAETPADATSIIDISADKIPGTVDGLTAGTGAPEIPAAETSTAATPQPPAIEEEETEEDAAKKIVATLETEVANARAALSHLKTSSNADHGGTIVAIAIKKFEAAITGLEAVLALIKKLGA